MSYTFLKKIKGSNARETKVVKNIIFSLFIKGGSILIAFIMVPLLINILSPESYGIWLTLTSFLSMFSFFNIGLGNGLKNLLISSIADKNWNEAKHLVSTAYVTLSLICLLAFLLFYGINCFIEWDVVLNAPLSLRNDLNILVLFVFGVLCLQLVFTLIVSILQAFQYPAYGDFIGVLGQLFAFIGLFLVSLFSAKQDLLTYGKVLVLAPLLSYLFCSIILFQGKYAKIRPSFSFFDKKYMRRLFTMGGKFFFIQIGALLLYQSNNLIIAHVVGSLDVAVYNVAYKYAGVSNMIFSLIIAPFWAASGDAYVRDDILWIRKALKKLNILWLFFVVACILQLFLSHFIYKLWIGSSLQISFYITMWCLIYFSLNMKSSIYCNIINGIGKIKMQFIMYLIQVLIHIPLAIFLGNMYGVVGILFSMCFIMLLNILWMSKQCNLLLKKEAMGLWNA